MFILDVKTDEFYCSQDLCEESLASFKFKKCLSLVPKSWLVWHWALRAFMPGILAISKNAQDEHGITFPKKKVSRECQRWVSLHNFLEFLPGEELKF